MNVALDRELVDALAERPDLLAVADAIAVTQARRRRSRRRPLALLVAAAALTAVALAAPWGDRGPDVVARARAALGTGPVIHAVVEYTGDDAVVDLQRGESRPRVHTVEYWFDAEREALHTRELTDGVQLSETVVTPNGGDSDLGHFDTDPGFTPQLEPALAGFVTRYRDALKDGSASPFGTATLDGRKVRLLWFDVSRTERQVVAVDPETYRPLSFQSIYRGERRGPEWRVLTIESLSREPGFFAPPKRSAPRPGTGIVFEAQGISLEEAERALGAVPVWLGKRFADQPLEEVLMSRTQATFSEGREVEGIVVRLVYGRVRISMASSLPGAYALGLEDGGDPSPPPGWIAITRGFGRHDSWEGELRSHGLYVSLNAPTREQLLEAARALRPVH
jgi:hypothetical protein